MSRIKDLDDEDAILRELEREEANDDVMNRLKEQRMMQYKSELERVRQMESTGHGRLIHVTMEKDLFPHTTESKYCIVHFIKKDFKRCQTMERHLEVLAERHFKTKFVSIEVEKAPFLVTKLNIQMLPCVIVFMNAVAVDRIIGLEDLGGDRYTLATLEKRLAQTSVITAKEEPLKPVFGFAKHNSDDDDSDNYD